jgi:RNA polymerase sigma factor (TIGR02999 family)
MRELPAIARICRRPTPRVRLRFLPNHAKLSVNQQLVGTRSRTDGLGLEYGVPQQLFDRWRAGDAQALSDLLPLIYEELRGLARKQLRGQRTDHTLQTTALIHEAYLRLVGRASASVQDHMHFVSLASRIMRQVLVDPARARLASKRQGGLRVTLSEAEDVAIQSELDVIAIDEALARLAELDAQQAQVVELRYFGGLSIQDTAQALRVSTATVKRDWTMARTWLRAELRPSGNS